MHRNGPDSTQAEEEEGGEEHNAHRETAEEGCPGTRSRGGVHPGSQALVHRCSPRGDVNHSAASDCTHTAETTKDRDEDAGANLPGHDESIPRRRDGGIRVDVPGAEGATTDQDDTGVRDVQIHHQEAIARGQAVAPRSEREEARADSEEGRRDSSTSSWPWIDEATSVAGGCEAGRVDQPDLRSDGQRDRAVESSEPAEADAELHSEVCRFFDGQTGPYQLADDIRGQDGRGSSQAVTIPSAVHDRERRVPDARADDPEPHGEQRNASATPLEATPRATPLNRPSVSTTCSEDSWVAVARVWTDNLTPTMSDVCGELAGVRANLTQAHGQIAELERRNKRVTSDASYSRRKFGEERKLRLVAEEESRIAAKGVSDHERYARAQCFLVLSLQRKLAKYAEGHVSMPVAELETRVKQLTLKLEESEALVAGLREMLTCDTDESSCEESDEELETMEEKGVGVEVSKKGKEKESTADRLRGSVGVAKNRLVPSRTFKGDASKPTAYQNWEKASTRHITAVVSGRPIEHVVTAVIRGTGTGSDKLEALRALAECVAFRPMARLLAKEAGGVLQEHWSARLSVHVWDRLSLSREHMEILRHLLSFIYDPVARIYRPIPIWVNPDDDTDVENVPCLVGRYKREKLFHELADACLIKVGANGRCERDARVCATDLYSNFAAALRKDFSAERPARPVLYFDGTGGSLGKGICHAEIGSANFTGDCRQSRDTLSPLALNEGNDHALPLRANMELAVNTFNELVAAGKVELRDGTSLPAEPIVVGDMQGLKCMAGMTESCHALFCKCRARGTDLDAGEGPQHQYGEEGKDFETYADALAFFEEVGCESKTEDFILACAHVSKGCHYGGKFTPFTCPDCGYSPTAAQYHADKLAFDSLTDDEQKKERKEHVATGAHFHVEKYMGPMTRGLGMLRYGADQLHLIYLNVFKHLFKYSVHEPLPDSKKKIVSTYLKAAGYYSYDAADDSDDPVKRWIGREVKRFLHEADQHLPFLLGLASSSIDVCEESEQCLNTAGEEEMDVSDDDDFNPTADEVAAEQQLESLQKLNATRWDRFLRWTAAIETPWEESDSTSYREKRALEYCNHARGRARDLLELKPTMASWVPHIACNIVPRQIVALGDPSRRAADACESIGACCKRIIKHLTRRRKIGSKFARGYIEQAFRRLAVHANLIHGPENAPYLQRKDSSLMQSGRKNAGRQREYGPQHSIRVKVEQEAECA